MSTNERYVDNRSLVHVIEDGKPYCLCGCRVEDFRRVFTFESGAHELCAICMNMMNQRKTEGKS
jgi:hypothetical protein